MSENLDKLKKELAKERNDLRQEHNRVVPTSELFFGRYEKADYLGFGKKSSIYDTSLVLGEITVGENVWIGPFTVLDGYHEKLVIGNYVSINSGVQIYTHDSTNHFLSKGVEGYRKARVEIGDYSVIGSMSIITAGVKIGKHCLVWANSLVTKDVPDYGIVSGNPAKIIGKVKVNNGKVKKEYF